ncbi:MAG: SufD family Fe-S cluster assembly protein [Candidatus Gracilibacteria bacterium]|nr:SufD family Fe-S cluster assembly protein [Candidatus Gracilibacteria bacterium]
MNITKNGFYKLSELNSEKITIGDNLIVVIFDDFFLTNSLFENVLSHRIQMDIGENSRVEYYGVLENRGDFDINFMQNKAFSTLSVRCLLLSKNGENIKSKIHSILQASNTKSDIHIISIVGKDGFIDLDGIIQIEKDIEKVDANLIEENIFLGNTGKVKGIPTLLVRSNDVKASHACKIERISDEKLFYLRSRGIGKENALSMMIESYISNMFKCISMIDEAFYKELFENIIKKIK